MPGTRGEFDRSLEAIEAKVAGLFTMIVEGLPPAAQALEGAGGETVLVQPGNAQSVPRES
jgi:hypothetical protein